MDELDAVLEEARSLGLLGPGPVARQRAHAEDLARGAGSFAGELLDLGSGGGLPGLVLLAGWPDARGVLLDAQRRRCDFLEQALRSLDLAGRATVECGRAEVLARRHDLRARFGLVVARGFGPPAATAECAVGFLAEGGALIVTEPPEGTGAGRWDTEGLAELGFGPAVPFRTGETGAVRMHLDRVADERWPRRDGVPAKRPLW